MSEPPLENRAGREAVIAYSRARYANPRTAVERMIAEQYGHDPAELGDSPEAVARRQLSGLGVPRDTVNALFEAHSLQEITDQLEFLPLRGAKSPARFIVAAVQNSYAPPTAVRLPQSLPSSQEPTRGQEPDAAPALLAGVSLPIPQATGEERAAKSAPTEEAHG